MALNKGEAIAVNQLVGWQLRGNKPDRYGNCVTENAAREAALFLVGRANKQLMAGLRPEDVKGAWEAPTALYVDEEDAR